VSFSWDSIIESPVLSNVSMYTTFCVLYVLYCSEKVVQIEWCIQLHSIISKKNCLRRALSPKRSFGINEKDGVLLSSIFFNVSARARQTHSPYTAGRNIFSKLRKARKLKAFQMSNINSSQFARGVICPRIAFYLLCIGAYNQRKNV
jgi:hypothetical protein